jgi:hypothetical protein
MDPEPDGQHTFGDLPTEVDPLDSGPPIYYTKRIHVQHDITGVLWR